MYDELQIAQFTSLGHIWALHLQSDTYVDYFYYFYLFVSKPKYQVFHTCGQYIRTKYEQASKRELV